jgi:hypothetical protein
MVPGSESGGMGPTGWGMTGMGGSTGMGGLAGGSTGMIAGDATTGGSSSTAGAKFIKPKAGLHVSVLQQQ